MRDKDWRSTAARESLRRGRPVGLTTPALHACDHASPFRAGTLFAHAVDTVSKHSSFITLDRAVRPGWAERVLIMLYLVSWLRSRGVALPLVRVAA